MVHALREVRRVLKPDGILIDLRPAPRHRHVGVMTNGVYQEVGVMRESLQDDWAANRAVAQVLQDKLFTAGPRTLVPCNRVLDSFAEFKIWLADFVSLARVASPDRLARRVERAYLAAGRGSRIVIRAPLTLGTLRKSRLQRET